jgi:hypothetical protein
MNCSYCETELRIVERSNNGIIKLEPYCDSCKKSFSIYWICPDYPDDSLVRVYKKLKSDYFNKDERNMNDD